MAKLYYIDQYNTEKMKEVKPASGKFTQQELSRYMNGGIVEKKTLPSGDVMVVDKERVLHALPVNYQATYHSIGEKHNEIIHGNALFCKPTEIQ